MADKEEKLARLFGSTSRARILAFLSSNSGQSYYQREIIYETGLSLQAVQRELGNLEELGIVKKRETNARAYYQINPTSPLFKPLREICGLVRGKWVKRGTSYNPPVKRKIELVKNSRVSKFALFWLHFCRKLYKELFPIDESLTSTNSEPNRYFYPMCPAIAGPSIIPNPDYRIQVRSPELSPTRSSASTLFLGLSRRI
jgi:predicted transcriptional regulator